MSKSLRLSEKWFRRGLWLVALIFASFLIGLGSRVVDDLPRVEKTLHVEDFMPAEAEALQKKVEDARLIQSNTDESLQQIRLQLSKVQSESRAERETFDNWLSARSVTQNDEHNPEVIARTRKLDELNQHERRIQVQLETQQQAYLDAYQAASSARAELQKLENIAYAALSEEARKVELRVFLYRLALTLPLLLIAGWLFVKKRKGTYWPFVWGFIFFALFAFFVELVPYLPSYGGYVRYLVGILLTVVIGRYAIIALTRYLERQKEIEALPDAQRRKDLSYDVALTRLAKNVCPGCERPVDLNNSTIDFCPHCGINLFDHCRHCQTRKSSFSHFCHACGSSTAQEQQP